MDEPQYIERRPFAKMHGLGNDFVIFDGRRDRFELTAAQAKFTADRRRGVGCDQVITMWPSENADVFMRIQNSDGSEAGACGNATRCVGDILLYETGAEKILIETLHGILTVERAEGLVKVDMGKALRDWQDIPLASAQDTDHVEINVGELSDGVAVNMGNPHIVFFLDDAEKIDLETLGAGIESHDLFPEKVNVSIVSKISDNKLRMRVFERGAGITEACGSAACSVMVAAHARGVTSRQAIIQLDGGMLYMNTREDGHVEMTGPAQLVYSGSVAFDQDEEVDG
jgi:diaminopimelate epimerase